MTQAPASPGWTPQQLAAIEHRTGNLIVSASAGSGKTAVLTERVLRLVTGSNGGPPVPIDRMLIITFTEKAAREMRERIEARLRKAVEEGGDARSRAHASAAIDALGGSWIMTIDAFCRRVVVENFHRAGVSPQPRVPDETELVRLEQLALDRLLEDRAASPESRAALAGLLRAYPGGVGGLRENLVHLMRFLESLDQPETWSARVRASIARTLAAQSIDELPEADAARQTFAISCRELADALREVASLAGQRPHDTGIPDRWEQLAGELEAIADGNGAPWADETRTAAERLAPTISGIMNKGECGGILYRDEEFRKSILERLSGHFRRWQKEWFALDAANWLEGARHAARQAARLLDLTEAALEQVREARRRRGLVSFNDFERLALQILSNEAGDGPSDVALAYRERFEYVLVDEFQDTSPLQNSIVARVARDGAGNLFVVGDYKQSIYRFRFAEPSLFLDLMQGGAGDARRFDHVALTRNFRSRAGILAFANAAFERLMDPIVGEIVYDERERLEATRVDGAWADPVCVEAHWIGRPDAPPEPLEPSEDGEEPEGGMVPERPLEFLKGAEAQAAWVARRIRELTDPAHGLRPAAGGEVTPAVIRPGDCAILLRSLRGEIGVWVAALEREGLKVRAGGFDPIATSPALLDLIAALRLADNPLQDIPLATVMRSPLAGFDDNDLVRIRLAHPDGAFHDAVWCAAGRVDPAAEPTDGDPLAPELAERVRTFVAMVDRWRALAATHPAAEVLDAVLRDTAYESYLSGRPDAAMTLHHVDYLRGLMRRLATPGDGRNALNAFLEQVDRAMEGTERIGELPDSVTDTGEAVHLLTIHAAKGLEYPVVFLPRLERRFRVGLSSDTLVDREHGLALRGVDPVRRRQYPTLAHHVLSDSQRRKERSEELRLLYVALTRARERLVLVGQTRGRDAWREKARWITVHADRPLTALERLHAGTPADLFGPIVEALAGQDTPPTWLRVDEEPPPATDDTPVDRPLLARALVRAGDNPEADWRCAAEQLCGEAGLAQPPEARHIRLLPTLDPAAPLTRLPLKTTVTALRLAANEQTAAAEAEAEREDDTFGEEEMLGAGYQRRATLEAVLPRWAAPATGATRLTGAQRGTLTHELLARLPLSPTPTAAAIREHALALCARNATPDCDAEVLVAQLDLDAIEWFFATDLGRHMLAHPSQVLRELPFTARKSVADLNPEAGLAFPGEAVLLQGIIDAMIDEGDTVTIFDYKTDRTHPALTIEDLVERYRLQLELYGRAIKAIWQPQRVRMALVFLNARRIVWPFE